MKKIIFEGDQSNLLSQGAQQLTLIDSSKHIKQASGNSEIRAMMADLKPDKDHFMVHLIALGDYEHFGENRNGDAFSKEACINYHDTFVKHANYFVEHANRDPEKRIGQVKASYYNADQGRIELLIHGHKVKAAKQYEAFKNGKGRSFSMACFPEGTNVWMADGSEKDIKDIKVGDEVITHKGNVGKVSNIMNRMYTDKGIRLKAYGLPEPITCTIDHGIWTRPVLKRKSGICPVCSKHYSSLSSHLAQSKDAKHRLAYNNYEKYAEGFVGAYALTKGDYIRTPINMDVLTEGNPHLATIAGYYLAEGNLYTADCKSHGKSYPNYRTEFTFHIKETHLVEELQQAYEKLGLPKPAAYPRPSCNKVTVRSHHKETYMWLQTHFGKYSHGKFVSPEIMGWSPVNQKIIFEKWLEGDGTFSSIHDTAIGITTSRRLAFDLTRMTPRFGVLINLHKRKDRPGKKSSFTLTVNRTSLDKLSYSKKPINFDPSVKPVTRTIAHLNYQADSAPVDVLNTNANLSYIENGYVYHKIASIEQVIINETVYDITVPGDHGFVAGGIGVSNCTIPYDVSSITGQKSATVAEYDEYCKYRMGQYIPEFQKYAFVYNPHPKFFDISDVENPADRIAHYLDYVLEGDAELRKAASSGGAIPSALIAELIHKHADAYSLESGFTNPSDIKLIERLISAENDIAASRTTKEASAKFDFIKHACVHAFSDAELSQSDIEKLRTLRPSTMLHKLAQAGVTLPLASFLAYIDGGDVNTIKSSATLKYANTHLMPSIFKKLTTTPLRDIPELFDPASEFESCSDPAWDKEASDLVNSLTSSLSVKTEPLTTRVCNLSGSTKTASVATHSDLTAEEIQDIEMKTLIYGCYKFASIKHMTKVLGHNVIDDARLLLLTYQHNS
jgi:hypothetical protein